MSKTKVVNVKVKYIRDNKQKDPNHKRYENLKEWMENPNHVYIGRQGIVFIKDKKTGKKERFPKRPSEFANPFKVNKTNSRNDVCKLFEIYIKNKINKNTELKKRLMNLKGKTLGCWCKPEACHGDILVNIIDSI